MERLQNKDKSKGDQKSVLFISHELSATGAPYCLKNMAKVFVELGYRIEIWTFPRVIDAHIFDELDCCIYVVPKYADNFKDLVLIVKKFSLIICNTVLTASYVNFFMNNGLNYLWMIHEGKLIPHFLNELGFDLEILEKHKLNSYVVSEYVSDYLYNEFNVRLPILHNFIEDEYNNNDKHQVLSDLPSVSKKVIFTFCGSMDANKRLDDCISAFLRLNTNLNAQWEFNIIGSLNKINEPFWSKLVDITESYTNIIWHDKLVGNDKLEIFRKTDVFLVPSKEETASLVVIEAAMLAKTFVITKNVGTKYLAKNNAAFVLDRFDIESIEDCIKSIIAMQKKELAAMGAMARKNYLATSTREIFKNNICSIIGKFNVDKSSDKTVLLSTENYLIGMREYLDHVVDKQREELSKKYRRQKRKYFKYVIINILTLNLIKKFRRKQKELRKKKY